MTDNLLRRRLDDGEPSVGTRVLTPWPGIVEILGETGEYDYVEFLAEYAPFDLHDLEGLARAAELAGLSTVMKVDAEPRTHLAQRALAAGFQNLLFADVETAADAEEAVRAVRPPPEGTNGIRMDRRIGYVGAYDSHETVHEDLVERGREAVVALMVETRAAVENLEEILAVEGVDMVQFGPSDYSLRVDEPGRVDGETVRDAECRTIETAKRMGVEPRVEISHPDEATAYREAYGVDHFNLGVDASVLHDWWRENGAALRERLGDGGA